MLKALKLLFLASIILLMFAVAYADDIWGPPDDPFDPSWLPPSGGDKGGRTSDTTLTISQLTHSEFPTITAYIDIVDENGDPIPGLTWEDFCVYQDGMPVGSFTVDSILGDSCHTSVCLVMDISASMCFPTSASLNGAKAAAHQFVDNMDDFDRVAIVTFSSCVNTLIGYTSNKDSLHTAINSLTCSGFTAAFDGIWLGVDETSTELGSKAVIAFTDGMENRSQDCWPPPDGIFYDREYADDSVIICDKANAAGVPIYTIGLGVADDVADPLRAFAGGTGGFYTYAPTADDMEFVYTAIKERICKRYIITYTSPDTIQDGDIHEVVVCLGGSGSCSFGAESFCDTGYYQETAPPEINQTPATLALLQTCQPVGTAIQICADVTDIADPPIQLVQLFYRKTGTTSYTSVDMTGTPYCAEIPASVVGAGPGVEYYIVASDGQQTVSDPPQSQNPQQNPYSIEMCANDPPECSVPNDTTIVQCTPAEVCLPVGCSDPDGNLTEGPTIVSGPGAIVGGNWCYTPSGDETVVVTIGCTDIVDEYCEGQFEVVFDINEPPVCSAPNDTAIFMCEAAEVCLPVSASDPDGNLVGCEIISGPGALDAGNWCYTPTGDESVEVTVKCTDECGEYCQESFTVEFDINEAPVCDIPDDATIFQCAPEQICLPVSATDGDGNLVGCEIIAGPGEINGGNWCYTPSGDESFEVIIKCTDECGAFCQGTFNVTVDINEAPVCALPENQSFFICADSSFSFPISATDADDNLTGCTMTSGSGSFDGSNWTFTTSGDGVYSATFECSDDCGAVCGGTVEITVQVNTPPVLTCPADMSIDCSSSTDPSNTGMATATDDHDPAPAVSYTDTETAGGCPQEKTISRRWKAVDECGDSAICIQTIAVEDNDAPVLTCPADLTIDCSASTDPSNTGSATATDNCDADVDIIYSDAMVDNIITRTWTATDDCDNSSSCVQVITIEDTTAPTLACPSDVSVQCIADVPAVDIGAVTASDDCDPNPVVTHVGDVSDGGSCPETITRTYRATDESGNYAECTQIITIDDDTAPTMTCPSDLTIDCSASTDPSNTGSATATDNCDADVYITYGDAVDDNIITRTWTATDDCDNSSSCVQVITIEDTTAPTLACPSDVSVQCIADVPAVDIGAVTVSDDCDPDPVVTHVGDVSDGGSCPEIITRTYRATDASGNFAECDQIITIDDDTAPTMTCPSDLTIDCSASTDPSNTGSATATDNCDADVDISYSDVVDDNIITRTWTATDDCDNSSSCVQIITIEDTTAPTLACPSDVAVQCISDVPAVDIGAVTVSDDCDPNPVVTHIGDVSDGGSCPETITRTYRATDESGNYAECTQIITIDDDTAPVIECPASLTIDCSDPTGPDNTGYATATDNCDSDPEITYSDDAIDNIITRTWTATDDCDNSSSCVQVITIEDTTAPTLTCPSDVSVQCIADVPAVDIGSVTVSDDCDPDPVVTHVGDVSDGGSCPETITRTYRATDASGNFAECDQIITIDDDTAPVVECPADVEVDCSQSTEPEFTGFATATDNCDANPEVTYSDSENGDIISRTWTATDDCGNTGDCMQTITVLPNDPPVCNLPPDQEFFVCSDTTFNFAVSATDDQAVTCTKTSGVGDFDGSTWSFTTTGPGVYTADFECTDICGASCGGTVTITVDYNAAPVCYVPNDTAIFQCEASEVCLPVWADDPDGNLAGCEVISGPGSIINGNWCYAPSGNETASVTVLCTDECGLTCEAGFEVEFTIHDRWAVLIVDRSGSMALVDLAGKSRLARARTQANLEIDKLLDLSDADFPGEYKIAVMTFNETAGIVLMQDFTDDGTLLHDAVDAIQNPRHDTPLAAAMCQGHCMMPMLDGCVRYLFTYTDGLENISQNFDMCDLCEPCNVYMESGWLYDCDPSDPGSCTDWQMCLSNEFATSGTNVVHYFGEPLNPYTKTNPPVDMYFLMAAAAGSDGLFFYHSDLEAPAYICGDANADQGINVSDAVYVINYVFVGGESPEPFEAADANCDGTVNVSDAVYIINYVFVGGAPPCDVNGDGAPDC